MPFHNLFWVQQRGAGLQMYMAEAVEVGNNPQSYFQQVLLAYDIGCWRECRLCFRVCPELGKCGNSNCFLNFML